MHSNAFTPMYMLPSSQTKVIFVHFYIKLICLCSPNCYWSRSFASQIVSTYSLLLYSIEKTYREIFLQMFSFLLSSQRILWFEGFSCFFCFFHCCWLEWGSNKLYYLEQVVCFIEEHRCVVKQGSQFQPTGSNIDISAVKFNYSLYIYNLIVTIEVLGLRMWWVHLWLFCLKMRTLLKAWTSRWITLDMHRFRWTIVFVSTVVPQQWERRARQPWLFICTIQNKYPNLNVLAFGEWLAGERENIEHKEQIFNFVFNIKL